MRFTEKLNSPFPFYLNDERKNLAFIVVVSAVVVFFLHAYRVPHNDHVLTLGQKIMFGAITGMVLVVNIIVGPRLFPRLYNTGHWTIKKYIVLTLWHCVLIGLVSGIAEKIYIFPNLSIWENLFRANRQVVQTGFLIIVIMTLFLKNNILGQRLRVAQHTPQPKPAPQPAEVSSQNDDNASAVHTSVTLQSETSETFTFHMPDLLYIEADDNYVTVVCRNGKGVYKKLLRANLKSIEGQLQPDAMLRCHRSYLVNVHAIAGVSGNASGYKLHVIDADIFIPVSRTKGKEVAERFRHLRNTRDVA